MKGDYLGSTSVQVIDTELTPYASPCNVSQSIDVRGISTPAMLPVEVLVGKDTLW